MDNQIQLPLVPFLSSARRDATVEVMSESGFGKVVTEDGVVVSVGKDCRYLSFISVWD